MKRYEGTGHFIVFEGLDGSGNTTQANILFNGLREKGIKSVLTKEPTEESEAGLKARRVLQGKEKASSKDLQSLFVEDRQEHLRNKIIPSLNSEKIVICDRYILSTAAFGGIDLSMETLINRNKDFIWPNNTFFLDVDPEICMERMKKRGTEQELFEELETLKKVRKNYLFLAKKFLRFGVCRIDGELPIKEVFNQITKVLSKSWLF